MFPRWGFTPRRCWNPHLGGPEPMVQRVRDAVAAYVEPGRIVGVLGGDHSVTIGSVRAHLDAWPGLSVLYLDAHADLRNEYMGTTWGHASGARRIHDLSPVTLVGVRSMCQEERDYIASRSVPIFPWPPAQDDRTYTESIVEQLGPLVYVSVDLDVFDPIDDGGGGYAGAGRHELAPGGFAAKSGGSIPANCRLRRLRAISGRGTLGMLLHRGETGLQASGLCRLGMPRGEHRGIGFRKITASRRRYS